MKQESSVSKMVKGLVLDGKRIKGVYKTVHEDKRTVEFEGGGSTVISKKQLAMMARIVGTADYIKRYLKATEQERKRMESKSKERQLRSKTLLVARKAEEAKESGQLSSKDIEELRGLLSTPVGNIYRLELPFMTMEDREIFASMLKRIG